MATQWIEGYRIEAERGRTPELVLWAARQLQQDAPVLLQIWEHASDADRSAMRQLAGQRHPGLAVVLDIGEANENTRAEAKPAGNKLYVALAGLPGPSLAERLREGMDLDQTCGMFRRLALILHHLHTRGDLLPGFDADSIFSDAQGRPVVTRIHQASAAYGFSTCVQQLGLLMHEALTGYAPAGDSAQLPDYLRRWQPLIDLCAPSSGVLKASDLIAQLDRLEGREAAAIKSPAPTDPATSHTAPATPASATTAAEVAASASASKTVPVDRSSDAETDVPAKARPADNAGMPAGIAAAGLDPVGVDHSRTTAPSRRLEQDSAADEPARRTPSRLPPGELIDKPSRLPLYTALSLAIPLSLLFAWWAFTGPEPEPPSASALSSPAPVRSPSSTLDKPADRGDGPLAVAPAGTTVTPLLPDELDLDPRLLSPIDIELAELPTVEDPVARFILFGRANLQAGRLIDPPQRNALERFQLALRIEPGNREAQAGIAEVAQRCLADARSAPLLDPKLQALACVETVARAHEAGRPAAEEASALRLAEVELRLSAATLALAEWRSVDASALYAEALRLDPASASAKAGQAEAQRQGKPGYRFSDPLQSGGVGPSLQILGSLAWGRFEVSRDEFARYWERAGEARFADSLPSCRDRESVFRGSRRRTWQAPDLPQDGTHPVICINAAMADHYAEWLSAETGQRYRLPRRSEWQAAAGAPPPACSINLRDQAAVQALNLRTASDCNDGHAYTAPVSAAGGDSGLRGLWGNVGEWLADCEGNNCRERLAAGGSWFSAADELQPRGFAAEPGFTTIGFRVVRELPAPN